MPNTILKRWNGTSFEELYPKTTVGQISASGTPNSTTFLRGDGQWAVPNGVDNYVNTAGDTMSGQLTSTVATGTAPFVIASTTRVSNLNVATAGTADTLTTGRTINVSTGATGTATSFNGSANISIPITGVSEAYLTWGGKSLSDQVTPIGMALSNEHSANRLAFINGDSLYFEYSSDGGSTWTDYGYSASIKSQVCTTSTGILIGRTSGEYTTSSRTRITLTAQNGTTGYVYTNPKKMLINISSSGGMNVLVEYRSGTNYQSSGAWTTFGTYSLIGWSGWNDIPLILGTLGGGTTQTGNNWQLRLTFIMTSKDVNYPTTAQLNAIRIFGENAWQVPSTLAGTNNLYSYDMSQNATFPGNLLGATVRTTQDGSAGAPGIGFSQDTNTGLFRPAEDTLAFAEGGVEAMRITSAGLVGINETSPTAQLQVKSGATTRVPLIVDTLASHTELLQAWRVNGNNVARIFSDGSFVSPYLNSAGLANSSSSNNANIATASTGTTISRNIADANPSLIVNQANASSTGDILRLQFAGANKLEITKDGFLNQNGTRLFSQPNGTSNTFFGISSGGASATGTDNTAFGLSALTSLTNASNNTAIGRSSLQLNNGSSNVAVGSYSGGTITTGLSNTFIGTSAGFNASQLATAQNSTAIGQGSYTDKSNQMVFGNASVSEFKFDRNTGATALLPRLSLSVASASSTREKLMDAVVSDDANSRFVISNGTSSDGVFAPSFGGISNNTTLWGLNFTGFLTASNDASNSSNFGVIDFNVSRTDSTTDPFNGTLTNISNRKAFTFRTGTTNLMTILPDGKVGIGTSGPAEALHIISNTANQGIRIERTSSTTGAYSLAIKSNGHFEIAESGVSTRMIIHKTTGLVGIGELTPTAQLQVKSEATTRVPLIVDSLTGHNTNLQEWRINGTPSVSISQFGVVVAPFFSNTSSNNALINTATNGTIISRNIADTNPALIVNLANSSATGPITKFQFNGTDRVTISADGTITGSNLTLSGDLTINGTTTNINTTNLVVEDKNIILGDVTTPSDTTADGGGITLKGATDKTITWVDSTDRWTSNQVFSAPNYVSTVATGTEPYATTSTTVNTNLNADLLDGNHASAFALASHTHTVSDISATGTPSATTVLAGNGNWLESNAHSHGNINLNGQITSLTITPADQDRILIADASNNGKIERGIIIGTSTSTFLREDGTWSSVTASNVGLGNVTNESKATMFTSPTFTGVVNLPNSNTVAINTGTTSGSITFNTAQTYTGPYLRGQVQDLYRGYYTSTYKIWDEGNDGSGSGLDADTVDGVQASAFPKAITKYKATGTSSTSGVTTRTAVTTITLLANKYYHLDVTGMYSKTSTSGSTAPVINIAVDNTTGTPTINGRFEWLNGSAATAYTVSNTNGAITTSDSARGFTAATATLSAITTTPWGLKALFYTGTSDKIITFYISSSSAVSGTCAVDMISIKATEVNS